jgi:hypothetical protein
MVALGLGLTLDFGLELGLLGLVWSGSGLSLALNYLDLIDYSWSER